MADTFRAEDLRAFLGRGWSVARESKRRAWAEHSKTHGVCGGFGVSQELWAHMRAVDPGWPDRTIRQQDLDHHLAVLTTLDRLKDVKLPR